MIFSGCLLLPHAENFLSSNVDLQTRGTRFLYMPSIPRDVLLTHICSYLEAVYSEWQIRCHHISTLVSRGLSQPLFTHTWNDIFGMPIVATCRKLPFKQCRSANQNDSFTVYALHTPGRAPSAFLKLPRSCLFRMTNSLSPYFYTSFQRLISTFIHTHLEWYFRDAHCCHMPKTSFQAMSICKPEGLVYCICPPYPGTCSLRILEAA
jgi:hypothetical protein